MDAKSTPKIDIIEVAAIEAIEASEGSVLEATNILVEAAENNKELFKHIMDPILRTACYNIIRSHIRAERKIVWMAPNYSASGNGERVVALGQLTLMEFRLPNGMFLKDASTDDTWSAAIFYENQSTDMGRKAQWLKRISLAAQDGIIGKKLTLEQIEQLHAEVMA